MDDRYLLQDFIPDWLKVVILVGLIAGAALSLVLFRLSARRSTEIGDESGDEERG